VSLKYVTYIFDAIHRLHMQSVREFSICNTAASVVLGESSSSTSPIKMHTRADMSANIYSSKEMASETPLSPHWQVPIRGLSDAGWCPMKWTVFDASWRFYITFMMAFSVTTVFYRILSYRTYYTVLYYIFQKYSMFLQHWITVTQSGTSKEPLGPIVRRKCVIKRMNALSSRPMNA
jgi:hypothetical protein